MSFGASCSKEAIDLATMDFPSVISYARAFLTPAADRKLHKYPTSVKLYFKDNRPPQAGEIFRNPDLARTLQRLVEAEKLARGKGRHEALESARAIVSTKATSRARWPGSRKPTAACFAYVDFAKYSAKIEEPVLSID
jgi:gamma-glutamyltranspeptidase/glutathione hydrolase